MRKAVLFASRSAGRVMDGNYKKAAVCCFFSCALVHAVCAAASHGWLWTRSSVSRQVGAPEMLIHLGHE